MKGTFRRGDYQPDAGRDIREEIEAHIEMEVEHFIAQGMGEEEARKEANALFGDRNRYESQALSEASAWERETRRRNRFGTLAQDVRYAMRSLAKTPGSTAIAIFSLALGVGANTVVFTAVNQFLLKPPQAIPNATRIVEVGRGQDGQGFQFLSYPDLLDLRRDADPFEEVAGCSMQDLTLSRGEGGDRVFGLLVSANYFNVLGVNPFIGRTFLSEEDEGRDEHAVVVLAYHIWKARMGADPDIAGSTVYLSRQPYTVVGVAPEGFRGHVALATVDVFVPLMQHSSLNEGRNYLDWRQTSWLQVLGLLGPNSTANEAGAAVATIYQRLAEEYPATHSRRTGSVRSFGALPVIIRGRAGIFLRILSVFAGLILLIICANVAGIFLAKARNRSKEVAIRRAIGAGRGRLFRHFLTESLLVFILGGVGGICLALWGFEMVTHLDVPGPLPTRINLAFDIRVLAFTSLLTLGMGFLFGLLQAIEVERVDLLSALKDDGGRQGSTEGRLWKGFVSAQVGACLVLLVAAGLLLRTLQHAAQIDKGFHAEGAYVTGLDLGTEGLEPHEVRPFQQEVLDFFTDEPWVEEVAMAIDLPLDQGAYGIHVVPEGWEAPAEQSRLYVDINMVSAGYMATLEIPVLAGREFDARDREGAEPVAVVNRTFVDEVWPGRSAVGRRVLWTDGPDIGLTVVGVVEDVHNQVLTERPGPQLYRPLAQVTRSDTHLLVRTHLSETQVVRLVHEGLRALDPHLALSTIVPLDRYTAVGVLPQRIAAFFSTGLGFLALLLSGMGVYGVMANTVSRRAREMGIRMALGADSGKVLRLVLRGAFCLALPGLGIGAVTAGGVAVLLRTLLLGISPLDPAAVISVTFVISVTVVASTLVPALRAARTNATVLLRNE